MDKETKALIDFYDKQIKDLEDKNKEKQEKLDKLWTLATNNSIYAEDWNDNCKSFDIVKILKEKINNVEDSRV